MSFGTGTEPRTSGDAGTSPEPGSTGESVADRAITRLDQDYGTLLRRAQSTTTRVSERIHPDLDANAYPLLVQIARNPRIRPSELAEHFGIGRATTTRQVTRLVELGLVGRTTDPDDSRSQSLTLTADGASRLTKARTRRHDWFREALVDWSEADLLQFTDLLARFTGALEDTGGTHGADRTG